VSFDRFSHISIRVGDMDRSRAFYRDTLGFTEVSELTVEHSPSFNEHGITGATLHAVFLRRDGVVIELQDVRDQATGDAVSGELHPFGLKHLSLRVTDMAASAQSVVDAGGDVLPWSRLRNPQRGTEVFFVTDPDGTRIELIEMPGDPAAPLGSPLGASPPES
jgi:catechol 2,3-dioxygenase-like lactoylglutathione lyase family enzyme